MNKFVLPIVMTIFSSCGYAVVLHNAVVLDHKSWISGEDKTGIAISGYFENKYQKHSKHPFLSSSASTSLRATASTTSVKGKVNINVYLKGSHGFSIHNTSGTHQVYTINITLCANSVNCFHDQTHIQVNNGGYYLNAGTSYLTCMFTTAGNYNLVATTVISGDVTSSAAGRAIIYIKD